MKFLHTMAFFHNPADLSALWTMAASGWRSRAYIVRYTGRLRSPIEVDVYVKTGGSDGP